MTIISKHLFYSKIGPETTCKEILHDWTDSCVKAHAGVMVQHVAKGVFIFYIPLHLLKLIIAYRKKDKHYLRKIVKAYLKAECFGVTFAFMTFASICFLLKLLGKANYYCVGYLPGFIGGASIFWEHPDGRRLNALLWSSLVIEALFNNCYHFRIFDYTPIKETVIFMLVNSALMYFAAKRDRKEIPFNLWFYTPHERKSVTSRDYLIEMCKYFGFGYGLSGARSLLARISTLYKNPMQTIFTSILNQNNFQIGLILATYVGLYRGVLHILENYRPNKKSNAAIAGFVAGLSYYIKPTMNILTIAIVTVLQLLFTEFPLSSKFKKLPLAEMVYMLSNAILLHQRLFAASICPRYYKNMVKIASGGYVDAVYENLIKKYFPSI